MDVKQSASGTFTGDLIVLCPLGGSGPCTGRVSGSSVTMLVKTTGWQLTGKVSQTGVISGDYTITGQEGTWIATPEVLPRLETRATGLRLWQQLSTPSQAFHSVVRTVLNAILVSGGVLFITFPSQIFNDTLDENYEEILAMWRRLLWRVRGKRRYAKLQTEDSRPSPRPCCRQAGDRYFWSRFGRRVRYRWLQRSDVRIQSCLSGEPIRNDRRVDGAYHCTVDGRPVYRRSGNTRSSSSCERYQWAGRRVLVRFVSRLTHFEPGYLYGLVCGVAFAHKLKEAEEGQSWPWNPWRS